jgi:DNA-3-methyladenine glycosylase I
VESDAMSKDLKKRGFKFVGSTICYAHMQATGMVNDIRLIVLDIAKYSKLINGDNINIIRRTTRLCATYTP